MLHFLNKKIKQNVFYDVYTCAEGNLIIIVQDSELLNYILVSLLKILAV